MSGADLHGVIEAMPQASPVRRQLQSIMIVAEVGESVQSARQGAGRFSRAALADEQNPLAVAHDQARVNLLNSLIAVPDLQNLRKRLGSLIAPDRCRLRAR